MTLPCPFHTVYRFASVLVSVAAFVKMYLWATQSKVTHCVAATTIWLWIYYSTMAALAVVQLLAHGGILVPAQYARCMGKWVLEHILGSKDKFYAYIGVCNVALILSICLSIFSMTVTIQCYASQTLLWSLDIFTSCMWIYVGCLRALAIKWGRVRDWFYLAWD